MAHTQKASPADRFRVPPSVTTWHLSRRLWRGPGHRPDGDDTADSLPQAFRLDISTPPAAGTPGAAQGGKTASHGS